ncbi:MAG: NUDIX hydrolase [Holosporaceae bacterium]|jgi:8-oxo-dGTP pyrophosphatase MutT (NUDIX family)|nr:NUDIX hydrolase [Holosporaceae bacterium]
MHRKNLRKKLEKYHPTDEREVADKAKMLEFLDSHEDCFERALSIGHFTGSCWIVNYDGTKFLLTLHKKAGRWLQLGGHADGDPDLVRVSIKEAHEESGLRHIELLSEEIFDIGVHLTAEYKGIPPHYHYDVRFLMRASNLHEDIKISAESDDLRWFDVPIAAPNFGDNIPRMFEKWKKSVVV